MPADGIDPYVQGHPQVLVEDVVGGDGRRRQQRVVAGVERGVVGAEDLIGGRHRLGLAGQGDVGRGAGRVVAAVVDLQAQGQGGLGHLDRVQVAVGVVVRRLGRAGRAALQGAAGRRGVGLEAGQLQVTALVAGAVAVDRGPEVLAGRSGAGRRCRTCSWGCPSGTGQDVLRGRRPGQRLVAAERSREKCRDTSASVIATVSWRLFPAWGDTTIEMVPPGTKPLRAAAASAAACDVGKSGIHTTPDRAAASAARWIVAARAYQPPMSTAKAAATTRVEHGRGEHDQHVAALVPVPHPAPPDAGPRASQVSLGSRRMTARSSMVSVDPKNPVSRGWRAETQTPR